MKLKKHDAESKITCPACGRASKYRADGQISGNPIDPEFLPKPGDLTECDHCKTLLVSGAGGSGLKLLECPPDRARMFHDLTADRKSSNKLSRVLAYVKKYRQMPKNLPPFRHLSSPSRRNQCLRIGTSATFRTRVANRSDSMISGGSPANEERS